MRFITHLENCLNQSPPTIFSDESFIEALLPSEADRYLLLQAIVGVVTVWTNDLIRSDAMIFNRLLDILLL